MTTTAADVLAKAKPRTKTVPICLDGELLGQIDDLKLTLAKTVKADMLAGEDLASSGNQLERQIAELEAEADEAATTFGLATIPGEEWDELKRRYPPSDEEWQRYRKSVEAAPMTASMTLSAPEFAFSEVIPRLIGLSVTEIDGEKVNWFEDDGLMLWKGLYDGARADLGDAVWSLNNRSANRPTSGIGTDTTPTTGPASTTRRNEVSPSPNS